MEIDFYKIQILKNDLILVNYLYTPPPEPKKLGALSEFMCRQHTGIGGNGTLFLEPGKVEKVKLRFILPNGKSSPVNNDALLCAARFSFDSGFSEGTQIRFEINGESRILDIIDSSNFRLSLGTPVFFESGQELIEKPDQDYNMNLKVKNRDYIVTPVSFGINGIVFFPGEMKTRFQKELSGRFKDVLKREYNFQPVFAQVYSREELLVRSWFTKTPVDFTSIAGMASVASVINGFADREPLVHLNRQELFVQWNGRTNHVLVTAKPEYVYSGSYYAEI